jgi:hypothetical protein
VPRPIYGARSPWTLNLPCERCKVMLHANVQPNFDGELAIFDWKHVLPGKPPNGPGLSYDSRHVPTPKFYVIEEEPGRD